MWVRPAHFRDRSCWEARPSSLEERRIGAFFDDSSKGRKEPEAEEDDSDSEEGTDPPPSIEDPESLRGKTPEEIEDLIPDGWVEGSPTRSGHGRRWKNPEKRGEQVRIMPGDPTNDPLEKRGPYVGVSRNGTQSPPIPLAGNPALRDQQ